MHKNGNGSNNGRRKIRFIDLFCGIGGFHSAAAQLGWKAVLACDINEAAQKAWDARFDHLNFKRLVPSVLVAESGGIETRDEYVSPHLPGDMAFAAAVAREMGPLPAVVAR